MFKFFPDLNFKPFLLFLLLIKWISEWKSFACHLSKSATFFFGYMRISYSWLLNTQKFQSQFFFGEHKIWKKILIKIECISIILSMNDNTANKLQTFKKQKKKQHYQIDQSIQIRIMYYINYFMYNILEFVMKKSIKMYSISMGFFFFIFFYTSFCCFSTSLNLNK